MQTLTVAISDIEYNKFGIKSNTYNFSEFVDLISKELMRQNLDHCVGLAEEYGLSKMTLEDINNEVQAVRQRAKQYT